MQAIKRSWELVKGKWWRTFGYAIVMIVILFIVSLLFNLIGVSLSFVHKHLPAEFLGSSSFEGFLVVGGFLYFLLQSAFNIVTQTIFTGF